MGIAVGGATVSLISYADVEAVGASSQRRLQYLMDSINKVSKAYREYCVDIAYLYFKIGSVCLCHLARYFLAPCDKHTHWPRPAVGRQPAQHGFHLERPCVATAQ